MKMRLTLLLTLTISVIFSTAATSKGAAPASVATANSATTATNGANDECHYRSSNLIPYYKKMAAERIFYIDDKAFATHKSLGKISVGELRGGKLFTSHFGGRWFYIDAFKVAKP